MLLHAKFVPTNKLVAKCCYETNPHDSLIPPCQILHALSFPHSFITKHVIMYKSKMTLPIVLHANTQPPPKESMQAVISQTLIKINNNNKIIK